MRFKKAIKKIMALSTGATMMGATILGAMAAADLANYPAPFIKDGKFNGVLVVGDKAAAEDVIGVSDIAVSMQFAATKAVSVGAAGTVSAEGEAWKVGVGSTKILEMSENLETASGTNREAIANITSNSFIDDSELPVLLASLTTSNSKGDAPYDQRLYFDAGIKSGYVQLIEDDNDVTADFLYFPTNEKIARYELEFTTNLESDVDDSAGSATTTGTYLTDIEDTDITMMGRPYTVVQARRLSSAGGGVKLILMGGAVKDTLLEGNTKTYTIDGKDYEVSLDFVDSNSAKFTINGEGTRDLLDGETDKMSDGTTIGVSEILYQDYAGGVHQAQFFLGAQKIELRDSLITDTGSSNELKVDDETIDGAEVIIEATDDNTTFKIDKVTINMTADDDYFVPAGGKLSENPELKEADLLFTKGWDIEYRGLSKELTQEINIKASGSDDYELEFVDGKGNKAKIPLINSPSGALIKFGDNDDDLIVQENKSIGKNDYFIITDYSDSDGERQSFALRYKGSDKITATDPKIKFDDLGSGETLERSISVGSALASVVGPQGAAGDGTGGILYQLAEIKLGGGTFRVYNTSSGASDDFTIAVDMDADSTITSRVLGLNTQYGANISIDNSTVGGVIVHIDTPNTDHYDDLNPSFLEFNLTAASGEVALALTDGQVHTFLTPEDDDKNDYAYTSYGAYVKRYKPTNDPNEIWIEYPQQQRVPLVYITAKGVTFTETGATTSEAVTLQKIEVGATKLASEVSNIKAVNSILVGGPCANAAAATILGNPSDCTAGFEPGVGRVELYENNGNVAMLVAGYAALDTRNAAQVVANYKDYKDQLKGTAVEVKKVNNVVTVAESTPKAGVTEEEISEETTA